jgi:NAD(P)H-dependent flavin oxidoreductase YrpB (nitropropane dioxygenase family)
MGASAAVHVVPLRVISRPSVPPGTSEYSPTAGDTDQSVIWAGQSAGLITSIKAASELIEEVVRDAERVIRTRAELVTAQGSASQ